MQLYARHSSSVQCLLWGLVILGMSHQAMCVRSVVPLSLDNSALDPNSARASRNGGELSC